MASGLPPPAPPRPSGSSEDPFRPKKKSDDPGLTPTPTKSRFPYLSMVCGPRPPSFISRLSTSRQATLHTARAYANARRRSRA
eukprot:scaffold67901_cov29-Tisochrysis_lutea.AAC.2